MKKQFTCINCPMGCQVVVTMEGEEITNIEGNNCKRGENYVRDEVKDPKRMVTSTVKVAGSKTYSVPVKTETAIPKGLIFDCMKEINNTEIKAPVHIGDVVIANVLDTGVNVIATDERE
ncbi:DUF1667 domain-containing protein [uncultured Anaerococcus sp.]|mgnify:FL=1|uniref:DUF1667 domain-containing protein n=1 Tax=uncultured Anaerococcus sp. TaxID=293428 RepID=UPI0025FCC932|nr:DUF1667 domain-containing protein [uncultured Anaerococcus sp.]